MPVPSGLTGPIDTWWSSRVVMWSSVSRHVPCETAPDAASRSQPPHTAPSSAPRRRAAAATACSRSKSSRRDVRPIACIAAAPPSALSPSSSGVHV